jgi:hypothetical protein
MGSATIIDGTSTGEQPAGNRWQGLAQPVASPFLGTALGLTGALDATWYLLVGPGDFSVVDIGFLNGVTVPTVETAQLDISRLGMGARAYFDFGAALFEKRGGVKAAGS